MEQVETPGVNYVAVAFDRSKVLFNGRLDLGLRCLNFGRVLGEAVCVFVVLDFLKLLFVGGCLGEVVVDVPVGGADGLLLDDVSNSGVIGFGDDDGARVVLLLSLKLGLQNVRGGLLGVGD